MNNTSGAIGVGWCKKFKKWVANVKANGKQKHIGYFDNISIAIAMRDIAAMEYHGDFVNLNSIKTRELAEEALKEIKLKLGR